MLCCSNVRALGLSGQCLSVCRFSFMHHVMWVGRLSRCLVAQRFRLPHRDLLASLCSFSLYHLTLLNISVLYPLTQGPMFFPFTRMLSQNAASRGWTDDSMIKSIFRGPRFSSQNPHGGLQPFVSLVPGTLTPSGLCRHQACTEWRQNTHT